MAKKVQSTINPGMTESEFDSALLKLVTSTKALKEEVWRMCKVAVLFALDGNITPAKKLVHNEDIKSALRTDSIKVWFVQFGPFKEGNGQWDGKTVKTLEMDSGKRVLMVKKASKDMPGLMADLGKMSPFDAKKSTADTPFNFAENIVKAIELAEKRKKAGKKGDFYGLDLPELKKLSVVLRQHMAESTNKAA